MKDQGWVNIYRAPNSAPDVGNERRYPQLLWRVLLCFYALLWILVLVIELGLRGGLYSKIIQLWMILISPGCHMYWPVFFVYAFSVKIGGQTFWRLSSIAYLVWMLLYHLVSALFPDQASIPHFLDTEDSWELGGLLFGLGLELLVSVAVLLYGFKAGFVWSRSEEKP